MKSAKPLWRVSVVTAREAEEAVGEALSATLNNAVTCYLDLKTVWSTVSAFCARRPAAGFRENISAALRRIRNCGLKTGPGRITIGRVRREDWAESWKRHFQPIEFGDELLIKPGWSKRRARKGQKVVVLDPGLGFGTGQHPTTAFCLRELVRCGKFKTPRSFFDIGTGSGILAIAAAKLGYAPVQAMDVDPEAVRVARANARRNRVHEKLWIRRRDVAELPLRTRDRYDLICANLTSPLLLAERQRIVAQLKRGGTLVLAGMLKSEFSRIHRIYAALGLKLAVNRTDSEWRSGSFKFAGNNSTANFE
jgi:ribosomal protein L11 methyltransferase